MSNLLFKRWNDFGGWLVFLIAAFVYGMTIEPTASFWDCPEFISCAEKLQVGHPPGAPFYMLCIPAIVLVFYYQKYQTLSLKGVIGAIALSGILIVLILFVYIPGMADVGGWFELFFVNVMGLPFQSGLIVFLGLVLFLLIGAIYRFRKRIVNTGLWCLLMLTIGYTYAVILIRANANTPLNENAPDNIFTLKSYLNREQYESAPLLYGRTYASEPEYVPEGDYYKVKTEKGSAIYRPDKKEGKYKIIRYKEDVCYTQNRLFPRMWNDHPAASYKGWSGGGTNEAPTQKENLTYFITYQLNYMYWRYFLWNFVAEKQEFHVIPTDAINIYIDKDAVLRSGMMLPEAIRHLKGEELRDAIPDKLSISLKDIRLLTKVDLLMLEILANCNWERPLYMAISVGNSSKLKFDDYFVQEGLAFRFTPFNYKEWGDVEEGNGYAIDTEKLYENVMNRYKYGGLDTPGLYLDETTLRICYSHRRLFAQLAKELVKQGDDIRARKVLEYAGQTIPAYNVPEVYESGSYDIATAYASIGETQKATDLLNHLIAESENYIDWAFSLGDNRIGMVQQDCLYRFWQWNQCNELLKSMDKKRYEQSNQQFEKKYMRFTQLMNYHN